MSNNANGSVNAVAKATVRREIREVTFDAPWDWLAAGWTDLWAHPAISLSYGLGIVAASLGLSVVLFHIGWQALIPALGGGFLIVGPLLAVGLYEISRRQEMGEPTTLAQALTSGFSAPGQLLFMGAVLVLIYFAWVRVALLLFALFWGASALPPVSDFLPQLLLTPHGLGLLVVGTATGAILAAFVYAISAVSIPMMLTERVDAVTAIGHSVSAVAKNPKAMGLWAVVIAALIAAGIATLSIGLIVAFPLVGHATWHAYRSVIGPQIET